MYAPWSSESIDSYLMMLLYVNEVEDYNVHIVYMNLHLHGRIKILFYAFISYKSD